MNAAIIVTCRAARGNLVTLLVDGRAVDTAPAGGALVRRFRGLVRDLREANPGADITLPGGIVDETAIIRDASILLA